MLFSVSEVFVNGKYNPSKAKKHIHEIKASVLHLNVFDCTTSEYVYNIVNGLTDVVLCCRCLNKARFSSAVLGYSKFCSTNCANKKNGNAQSNTKRNFSKEKLDTIKTKRENTNINKYGVTNPMFLDSIKLKIENVFLEKYGVTCSLQNETVKQKAKDTLLARYGRENISQAHIRNDSFESLNSKQWFINNYQEQQTSITYLAHNLGVDKTTVSGRIKGFGIDVKACKDTLPETIIANMLDSLNINYIKKDRKILGGKELDFYIPSLKLAIEYNGLYWHSSNSYPEHIDKVRHRTKYEMCVKIGIQLIQLTGLDFTAIEKLLTAKLMKCNKIYARNCTIVELSSDKFREFCQEHHFQGYAACKIKYGLLYNNELVACIGFNRANKYDWELTRLVFDNAIVGGSSKMLKYFRNNHTGSIVSYSSNSYSNGNVYNVLGFKEVAETKYDMWYVDNNKQCLLNRRNFQKKKLDSKLYKYDNKLTEIHNMLNNGYRVYFGPGTKTWVLL